MQNILENSGAYNYDKYYPNLLSIILYRSSSSGAPSISSYTDRTVKNCFPPSEAAATAFILPGLYYRLIIGLIDGDALDEALGKLTFAKWTRVVRKNGNAFRYMQSQRNGSICLLVK